MGLRSFFHKIKIGFVRRRENPLPYVSEVKWYGNMGEDAFTYWLNSALPTCKIKRNVVIDTPEGNAEIDCLVLYENKLFAIEVKRWKGRLIETENGFIQQKTDYWTGELHSKALKSPFKQLNRAVYLLKKQIPSVAWVNSIVFFEDDEFESIEMLSDGVWFCDLEMLIKYLVGDGRQSRQYDAEYLFERCVAADYLHANHWNKSLRCVIADDSLRFQTSQGEICREQISCIRITHHWSYDELNITLKNGAMFCITQENAKIRVRENGEARECALCKLDYVELGQ